MIARAIRILAIAVPLLVLGGAAAWYYGWLTPGGGLSGSGIASIGGPFTLIDQDGKTRTAADFRGKLMLVYFGYTYCPDVCPTTLQIMSVALDKLGDKAKEVQPIFITIDPVRDTPAKLKAYLANFRPGFIGLTGSAAQVAVAARAYRVYYAKSGATDAEKDYLMDHTSSVYLMGRDGRYLDHFTVNNQPEDIAKAIAKRL